MIVFNKVLPQVPQGGRSLMNDILKLSLFRTGC